MRYSSYFLSAVLLSLIACSEGNDPTAQSTTPASTRSSGTAALPRTTDDWHTTDTLFRMMGGVEGKVVADLFVGDGYYTMKLLEAGARVIALDDDPRNIEAITARKKEMNIGDDRLLIRSCTPGSPNLSVGEVDLALCTRPFISIPDPTGYFTKVKAAIKPPCQLFIVDFLQEQTPVGTPMDQRVPSEMVMDAMEPAGFTDIGAYGLKLPYRFVVHALDFVETPGAGEMAPNAVQ
ncbi:MAG: class I SAM-dependent methyltransferase [Flavobacteriales bacterium]|nr:class I SAM-dependent methyltransferase [Flavobacteriales bacterium]